jgi:hypothetical protein
MSVVFVSFRRVTGMVCIPPPGPVRGPSGPVSHYVHTYEDQHDYQNDDDHKHPSAGHVTGIVGMIATPVSITLLLPSSYMVARPVVSRYFLNTRSTYPG